MGHKENTTSTSSFHSESAFYSGLQVMNWQTWTEYVQLRGAIIDDGVKLPETFNVQTAPERVTDTYDVQARTGMKILRSGAGVKAKYYVTEEGDNFYPAGDKPYAHDGPGYFLDHYERVQDAIVYINEMERDRGKLAYFSDSGEYLNEDPRGCYVQFNFWQGTEGGNPRIYAIGDRLNDEGEWEKNVCLGFESNAFDCVTSEHNSLAYMTFGLYCRGKVKCLVFCYGGTGVVKNVGITRFYATITDYPELLAQEQTMQKASLKNVTHGVNEFHFDTSYYKDRVVVTQLGYDKGWSVKATLPDGTKKDCQMLRLDGGLVGFVAPGVTDENNNPLKVTYEMRYSTPYSLGGLGLWALGVVLYGGYLGFTFYSDAKRKKKALGLKA